MNLVHLEHMVSRRKHHVLAFREDHGLQYIDNLCDVGHFHPIRIFVENM